MILFGFGWAKPVPVNIYRFKNHRLGFALTAFAGPISNILMALVAMIILKLFLLFAILSGNVTNLLIIETIFFYIVYLNLFLAIFNMIPLPPLDGSRVLGLFMSDRAYDKYLRTTEPYSMYCMFGVLILARMQVFPIRSIVNWAVDGLDYITGFIA
jgi:Zn-dependent protease